MKIALVYPDDISIWLFRQELIRELASRGHDVVLISKPGEFVERLEALGCRHIPIDMARFVDPRRDIKVLWQMWRIFRKERFDIVQNFTVKPNTYGAFMAKLAGVPLILNSVTGLGFVYREPGEGLKTRAMKTVLEWMYRLAGRIAARTWFQNPDDIEYFLQHKLIKKDRPVLIRSSGINLEEWRLDQDAIEMGRSRRQELGIDEDQVVFMMVTRALKSKGTLEFLSAADAVAAKYPDARFVFVGSAEQNMDLGTPAETLEKKTQESPHFMWLGHRNDVRHLMSAANVIVLPSYYREGVPRCTLEGMALEKPIVTCDSVGCRESVDDGVTGFKIPPRDPEALTDAFVAFMEDRSLMASMGKAGRAKAEAEFDEKYVVSCLLKELYEI